jgi:transcriptional regulator with XRE-family HTH domain
MQAKLQGTIAAEVRAEMARQSKTQRQLGAAVGLDQAIVSRCLSGERAFRAHELVLVARFLGKSVEHFAPETDTVEATA